MTELHAGLELYREQLRRAIERNLHNLGRRRRNGRRVLRIAVPTAAALAAGALALTFTGGGAPMQSADAAILHHVAAELTAPPATILHERAMVTAEWGTAPYELWIENVPPYHYHVLKWDHQGSGIGGAPYAMPAELRALVQSGNATVAGTATIDGVPAYQLTISGASDRFLNGTAYVAQSDYRPLLIETTANGGERIVFQTYEYLPATAANLQLLDTAAPAGTSTASSSSSSS
jgi:hypothetical protein